MFRTNLLAAALITIDVLDANAWAKALKLISIANTIAQSVDALVINCELANVCKSADGINKMYLMSQDGLIAKRISAPSLASVLCALSIGYDVVLVDGTTYWHDILGRASAILNKPLVSNVCALSATPGEYVRRVSAGKLLQYVKCEYSKPWLLSVDTLCFNTSNVHVTGIKTQIFHNIIKTSCTLLKYESPRRTNALSLCDAKIVVAGGKAFGSAQIFNKYLQPLAIKLNASIGATRAAVDAGIAPIDYQIGQTGKIIAPKLYIAFGISGSDHHMMGVKDAHTILAVNTDPTAPISKLANYTIVADMFELIPKLLSFLP
ncbi:Electron transfer flavoprotein large subunit [Candidatus Hodgkinia cicadicola]|nr:Electron transfer flavoprotein large subunit [Candidatus Hodgkinia cicadicola]